jgi:hypothetical protein
MCKLRQRYAGVEGYVIECPDCSLLHVGFGTTILCLNGDEFRKFTAMVAFRAELSVVSTSDEGRVVLPTSSTSCRICLSTDELQSLNHMLQTVENEILTEGLLRLFEA